MRTWLGTTWRPALRLLLLSAAGCSPMGRFDVMVTLDREQFQKKLNTIPSVEINLVGVNLIEYPTWYGQSMTTYWEPDNALRQTAFSKRDAHVMTFGEPQALRQTLYRSSAIWDHWASKDTMQLFVLSNYPRVAEDRPGNTDPRRLILPLDKQRWRGYFWGKRVISIEVTPSGLLCHTPPMPVLE